MIERACKYGCGRAVEAGKSRCRTCRRHDKAEQRPSLVRPGGPRVLLIDIETSPNLVYTWGLWNQNIGINQIVEPTRMLCFAAKWLGEPGVMFHRATSDADQRSLVAAAYDLLDEADVVIHYYGSRFDVPHLYREFLVHELAPPSPFKQVDLKFAVSKRFKFPSNKLQFVSQAIGLSGKEETGGFDLWRGCMNGDSKSWKTMEKYNRRDVTLLEEVYEHLLPWIPNVPHRHLYDAGAGDCPNCGGNDVYEAGLYRTPLSVFTKYRCTDCGSWFRSSKRVSGTTMQAAVLS
jgi:hypothetical protein